MDLRFRPGTATVLNPEGGVERTDIRVGAHGGLEVRGPVIAKDPCIGGRGIEVRKAVVVKRKPPSIKTAAEELDVFPGLNVVHGDRSVRHGFHVVQNLWGCLQSIHHVTEHVFHDHVKRVLVGQRRRKVNLTGCFNTTACSDSVGDGVHHLTGAVLDADFNIEIFEEGIGKHTVVDVHGVIQPVPITVTKNGVVQREGGWRGDASSLNVHHAGWVRWTARGVIAICNGAGIPGDDPDFIGKISKSRHEAGGDVVDKVKLRDRPQAIGGGLGHDNTIELAFVCGEAKRQRSW